jgi:preprotein translocase subunit SecY
MPVQYLKLYLNHSRCFLSNSSFTYHPIIPRYLIWTSYWHRRYKNKLTSPFLIVLILVYGILLIFFSFLPILLVSSFYVYPFCRLQFLQEAKGKEKFTPRDKWKCKQTNTFRHIKLWFTNTIHTALYTRLKLCACFYVCECVCLCCR